MRPPINATIEPALGYSNIFGAYCEAISASFDLMLEEVFRAVIDRTALHRINIENSIRYGIISIDDIIKINDCCFDGHSFKITHSLRFYSPDRRSIMFGNDAVSYSHRNVFHEEVIILEHRDTLYEMDLPIRLNDAVPVVKNHPKELFQWLQLLIREVDMLMPGDIGSVYGTFEFTDPFGPAM